MGLCVGTGAAVVGAGDGAAVVGDTVGPTMGGTVGASVGPRVGAAVVGDAVGSGEGAIVLGITRMDGAAVGTVPSPPCPCTDEAWLEPDLLP